MFIYGKHMGKLINWFKDNILLVLTVGLIAFIPLYPKIPLIHVNRTWVYVRLEDFLVACALGIFGISLLRRKKFPESSLTIPIIVYWIIGAFSLVISILFIGPHLANFFPHIAILNYIRRIEYMSLFFLAYSSMKRNKNLPITIWVMLITTVIIILYGLGQKFLGWPAFLTMNEEFAKGIPLRLPPTARIPSTFGGHYDLAAYLVFMIPILGSLVFGLAKFWQKFIFLIATIASLGLLLLTASRVSFGAYLVGITVMLIWQKKKIWIVPVLIMSFVMLNMVSTAADRFYKTLRFSDVIVDLSTGKPIGTLDKIEGGSALVEKSASPAEENLPTGSEYINVPSNESPKTTKTIKTVEYFTSADLASGSGEIATISGSFLIQKALVYDISVTTRLQAEWPNAITAFKRNILLGSGYSTISLATDGDYLRMLGETGILGTISFLGILYFGFILFFRFKDTLDSMQRAFVIGVFAGLTGLLLNAILIDVFEASKVAFVFWLVMGVCLSLLEAKHKRLDSYPQILWKAFTSRIAYSIYLALTVFWVFKPVLSGYFIGDDFTWLKWAASSTIRDLFNYFSNAQGFFYRPLPKLWYFILYSVFWLKPFPYHLLSLILFLVSVICLYLIMLKLKIRNLFAFSFAFLFAVLSVHHENVFWISGQSSLLTAALFFLSLIGSINLWQGQKKLRVFSSMLVILLMFAAMLCYDGMLIGPLLIWIIGWLIFRQKPLSMIWINLLIPIYWYFRSVSGAVTPSGDYGYNMHKFFYNAAGNGIGYFSAVFFGPQVMDIFIPIRNYFRQHFIHAFTLIGGVSVIFIGIGIRIRKSIYYFQDSLVFVLVAIISLLPYLGLGAMSERYVLIASGFTIVAISLAVQTISNRTRSNAYNFVIVLICFAISFLNIKEISRVSFDWQKASDISQTTVLTMRKQFFPLISDTRFIFINTPIRYGRAWIFPTGMNDVLWHLFRVNGYSFVTESAKDIPSAFTYQEKLGLATYVFTFENYKIKRIIKEVKVVDEEP
jgi:hypothetical protein